MNEKEVEFYLDSCEVFAIKKWSHWNHTKTINKQNKSNLKILFLEAANLILQGICKLVCIFNL